MDKDEKIMNFLVSKGKRQAMNKKGQLGNLQGIVLTLVIVGILIGAAFFVLEEFHAQAVALNTTGLGANAQSALGINQTITALRTVPNLLGLIVLIAVIGIILAVVFNVIPGARMVGA